MARREARRDGRVQRRDPARSSPALELWQERGSAYYRAASGRIVTQWPGSMPEMERALASLDEDAYEAAARA